MPSAARVALTHRCGEDLIDVEAEVAGSAAFSLPDATLTLGTGEGHSLEVVFTAPDGDPHPATLELRTEDREALGVHLEGVAEADWDGDGHADVRAGGGDCDDEDPDVHPDAEERCNDVDDDCNGDVDDLVRDWYPDRDGDGWGGGDPVDGGCDAPEGHWAYEADCDDTDPTIFPGAEEIPCEGVDRDCDGSREDAAVVGSVAYGPIQEALDASADGDVVEICPGTWTEQLSIEEKALTLRARDGDPRTTVLDGGEALQILSIEDGELTLRHLGFSRGQALREQSYQGRGGAIHARNTRVEIEDCVFTDNNADVMGGAVYLSFNKRWGGTEPSSILDSSFTGNTTGESGVGGAVTVDVHGTVLDVEIAGTTFEDNLAYDGGALHWGTVYSEGDLTLEDCSFEGNWAEHGGGAVALADSSASTTLIEGCTFHDNGSKHWGGALDVGDYGGGDWISITHSTFTANQSASGGGAMTLGGLGTIDLEVADSVFSANVSEEGAVLLGAASLDLDFLRTSFQDNTAGEGASVLAFQSTTEACHVVLDTCTLTGNDSIPPHHGAVVLIEACDLESVDTDWGTGATDNEPSDLCDVSACNDILGESEDFACVAGECA